MTKDKVIFVEGEIDKKYIEYISSLNLTGFSLPKGVEIVAYGGKDALKNSIMLRFVLEKFKKFHITFDLDAKSELTKTLSSLNLTDGVDFSAIGKDAPGADCIEGLLPEWIKSNVYGANSGLVTALGSQKTTDRKSAKNKLKKLLLDRFIEEESLNHDDLKLFKPFFTTVSKIFSK